MNLAEVIYQHSLSLPEPAAREVLDFIEFLEQRHGQPQTQLEEDTEKRRQALEHITSMRVKWQGKPIEKRDELYDEARE